jgi:hypothetical protein
MIALPILGGVSGGRIVLMRLWSLHPSLLDAKGLVALWREALLAQKVLQGKTSGYRAHPQLQRFQQSSDPLAAISAYLWGIHDEAVQRGYAFDASKIVKRRKRLVLPVSAGQIEFELRHLKAKLRRRDPKRNRTLRHSDHVKTHPLFKVVAGAVESWEMGEGKKERSK